ncbi:MAG: penicillin-binding transpeptidase domain-containing protein, partial [Clostridium sp.]
KTPRGNILDKDGEVLATNQESYIVTYTETKEAKQKFFNSIEELYKILESNGETVLDDMLLKINDNNELYFDYKTSSEENQKAEEIRFKRDRGLNEAIEKTLFKNIDRDLKDDEIKKVNEELLKISPKETFDIMVKDYSMVGLVDKDYLKTENSKTYKEMKPSELTDLILKSKSLKEIRKYMLIKDTMKMQGFKGENVVTLVENIKEETFLTISQRLNNMPGVDVKNQPIRVYPNKTLASSILGYISPIDEAQKKNYELKGYNPSVDLVGKQGIEGAFEDELKGIKGGTSAKVNSKGRTTEELFKLESSPGKTVQLTIDKDLQYVTEQALKDQLEWIRKNAADGTKRYPNANRGTALVIDVNTGKILALASYPDFDPNKFAVKGGLTNEEYKQYFNPDLEKYGQELIKKTGLNTTVDKLFPPDGNGGRRDAFDLYPKPFYNYGTLGLIPPGSTFKPMTAVVGLEEGVIDKNSLIYDSGKFNMHKELVGFEPKCWNKAGHGNVDVTRALQTSCNVFFYETGYRLYKKNGGDLKALNSIAEYAWKFGLGVDPNGKTKSGTGIEIEENFGNVYNFETSKKDLAAFATFQLAEYLESGNYNNGSAYFVPFDYVYSDNDTEELHQLKDNIKTKINERLLAIGSPMKMSADDFSSYILEDVKKIMTTSEKYKNNVQKYESQKGKVNEEKEAQKVANVISKFVCSDKETEITSPGQLITASIGQGTNNFTPLQLGSYMSTLANGGTRYKLTLVDKILDYEGNVIKENKPEVLDKIDIKPETLRLVKEGMSKVNDAEGGTATAAFSGFPIQTAGKTGTADFREDQESLGREPFATYVSFAPLDKPEIAFIGIIYDGGHGGWTAPVARAVYEEYFKDRIKKDYPNYSSPSFNKYVVNKKFN